MKHDYKKIIQIILFPALVFVFNKLVNMQLDLYSMFPWLDIPMHFIGGASIAVSTALLWRYKYDNQKTTVISRSFIFFWIIGIVSFTAIVWEFYEFTSDYFFHTEWQIGATDTTGDLFFGLLGGCVAGWYLTRGFNRGKK